MSLDTMDQQSTRSWPATAIQRWMQTHDEAHADSGYHVLPFTWRVSGQVDWTAFTAAFRAVCERHPVLTARLLPQDGGWHQEVQPVESIPLELVDGTRVPDPDRRAWLQGIYDESCRTPMRLTGTPMRMRVVQLAEEFLVLGAAHVAVCDIESMAIVTADLWAAYAGLVDGTGADLPAPASTFGDFAIREAGRALREEHLVWWTDRLRDAELVTPLAVDLPAGLSDPVGPTAYWKIGGAPTALAARAIATQERVSEHAVLLAAFALMLTRRTGRSGLVVADPVSLRRSTELFGVVGPLTDVLWIPLTVSTQSLRELVRPVFAQVLGALARPVPVERLAAELTGRADGRTGPNVQCVYYPPERVANPEWVASSVAVTEVMPVPLLTGPLQSPFWLDLTIAGERHQPDTDFSLVYRTDLFLPETARRMADEIEDIILQAVGDGDGGG